MRRVVRPRRLVRTADRTTQELSAVDSRPLPWSWAPFGWLGRSPRLTGKAARIIAVAVGYEIDSKT